MNIRPNRFIAMLLAVLIIAAQPFAAGAIDGGQRVLADELVLEDGFDSLQLTVQSYESTANGTGSIYSTLTTRQKASYNELKNISYSSIMASADNSVSVNISGINGTQLTGTGVNGTFVATGASAEVYNAIRNDMNTAIAALRYDRPDMLWLDYMVGSYFTFRGSYGSYAISDVRYRFYLPYSGRESTMRDRMMAEARNIASEASKQKDMYSKVKKVHDMLAARATYNWSSFNNTASEMVTRISHSAYSAMVGGDPYEPVCDGYSKAFKIVLNLMDIPCVTAVSDDHMWNNVKMDDGLWYNVDLTWDDTGDPTVTGTDYFLVGSGTAIYGRAFSQSHPEYDPFNMSVKNSSRYPRKNTAAYRYIGGDYPKTTYPDVPRSDYAYEYIEQVSKLGYFTGDTAGYFHPGKQITRAEFAKVTASVLGADVEQYNGMYSFSDVGTGRWYSGVAYWARESGVMVGDGRSFRPNDPISRQEMCAVLARAFGLEGSSGRVFPDDGSIDSWAKAGVYACNAAGLVNGRTNGSFAPKDSTVRRDAAIVFAKYAQLIGAVPSGGR